MCQAQVVRGDRRFFEIHTPVEGAGHGFDFFEIPCDSEQPRNAAKWEGRAIGKFVHGLTKRFGIRQNVVAWEKRAQGSHTDILFTTKDGPKVSANDVKQHTYVCPVCTNNIVQKTQQWPGDGHLRPTCSICCLRATWWTLAEIAKQTTDAEKAQGSATRGKWLEVPHGTAYYTELQEMYNAVGSQNFELGEVRKREDTQNMYLTGIAVQWLLRRVQTLTRTLINSEAKWSTSWGDPSFARWTPQADVTSVPWIHALLLEAGVPYHSINLGYAQMAITSGGGYSNKKLY